MSWDTDDIAAIPIVRDVQTQDLQAFIRHAHARLDEMAKQWAREQDDVPDWIGAGHPRAPYEMRRKLDVLEMAWRIRNT